MTISIVATSISEGLAQLARILDAPVPPFGYGSDISCERDLDPAMAEVDPLSALALAQALVRRLDCPRGALVDDPDYGMDLRAELNRGTTTRDLNAIAARIRSELTKDDRVSSVKVTVSYADLVAREMTVSIVVTPVDATIGGFSMTLAVTSAEVVISSMSGRG